MKELVWDGVIIKLGQNDVENWKLINQMRHENENYVWVHLEKYPSGHAIIEGTFSDVDTNIIKIAGEFCRDNTKYRNLKNVKIVCTTLKNLKPGNKEGEVIYKKPRDVFTYKI